MPYKHLFFDMDGTVTEPRSLIEHELERLLDELPHDIIIVSGSHNDQMRVQIPNARIYQLGQNGNQAFDTEQNELWNLKLESHHRKEILSHIEQLIQALDHELNEAWAPIEDRGGQITFSPVGNQAPIELKRMYDPDKRKRLKLMEEIPLVSEEIVVKIGGSTSIDYIHKDRHKGTNVQKLILHNDWNPDECIYFGDGLYPGGNDEAVIGVIETVLVTDHKDTEQRLRQMFT